MVPKCFSDIFVGSDKANFNFWQEIKHEATTKYVIKFRR
jgi:hypothetical protein